MATLTIRNLDDELKASLRVQAALHGQSMEEEVRSILRQALGKSAPTQGLGQRLLGRFQGVTGGGTLPVARLHPGDAQHGGFRGDRGARHARSLAGLSNRRRSG